MSVFKSSVSVLYPDNCRIQKSPSRGYFSRKYLTNLLKEIQINSSIDLLYMLISVMIKRFRSLNFVDMQNLMVMP